MEQLYFKHSGFAARLLALIIDGIIILVIVFLLNIIILLTTGQSPNYSKGSLFQLLAILVSLAYGITLVSLYGATLGKMLLHIKIVNINYQKVNFFQVLKRETIGKIISGLVFNLGYLWAAIDDKKQAWHDKIAKTYVIHNQPISYEEYVKQQEKSKLGSLPYLLVFAGLVEAIFVSIFPSLIIQKLTPLYENFGQVGYNPLTTSLIYLISGLMGFSCFIQIIWGIILWSKKKTPETINSNYIKTGKVLLILGAVLFLLLIPFLILSVILPIYRVTTSF